MSKEDYLSTIYKLRDDSGEIKPNSIAESLDISNAAVTDMLKKLSRDDLIDYKKYRGIKLTKSGELYAKNMVRRHRLWETFLYKVLDLPWDKIHDEAEKLEHSSSEQLINRIEEFLKYPEYDPHGYPIPDKKGKLPKTQDLMAASELRKNEKAKVLRVRDFSSEMLAYIHKIGLRLGQEITVKNVLEYDGSLQIVINKKELNISKKIASNIFVERI